MGATGVDRRIRGERGNLRRSRDLSSGIPQRRIHSDVKDKSSLPRHEVEMGRAALLGLTAGLSVEAIAKVQVESAPQHSGTADSKSGDSAELGNDNPAQRISQGKSEDDRASWAEHDNQSKSLPNELQSDNALSLNEEQPCKKTSDKGNVRVYCRFRPQNAMEQENSARTCVELDGQDGVILANSSATGEQRFNFDRVFAPEVDQEEVYNSTVKDVVEEVLQGFNCTVFAYGQTGSGKTHTMVGPLSLVNDKTSSARGVIPRAIEEIFRYKEDNQAAQNVEVSASYIEIYMEKIRDLLSPHTTDIRIREDKTKGVQITGTEERKAKTGESLLQILEEGNLNRAVGSTKMNKDSSRSHSVFVINVKRSEKLRGVDRSGRLYLVDLAGSETVKKTNAEGQTLEEAKMINKSLSALGNVIRALVEGKGHTPYRDSKLTRILQDSLGGNSKTTMIITCSISSFNMQETLSTLRFGQRAKLIVNKAKANEEFNSADYKKIIETLQLQMAQQQNYIASLEGKLTSFVQMATASMTSGRAVQEGREGVKEANLKENKQDESGPEEDEQETSPNQKENDIPTKPNITEAIELPYTAQIVEHSQSPCNSVEEILDIGTTSEEEIEEETTSQDEEMSPPPNVTTAFSVEMSSAEDQSLMEKSSTPTNALTMQPTLRRQSPVRVHASAREGSGSVPSHLVNVEDIIKCFGEKVNFSNVRRDPNSGRARSFDSRAYSHSRRGSRWNVAHVGVNTDREDFLSLRKDSSTNTDVALGSFMDRVQDNRVEDAQNAEVKGRNSEEEQQISLAREKERTNLALAEVETLINSTRELKKKLDQAEKEKRLAEESAQAAVTKAAENRSILNKWMNRMQMVSSLHDEQASSFVADPFSRLAELQSLPKYELPSELSGIQDPATNGMDHNLARKLEKDLEHMTRQFVEMKLEAHYTQEQTFQMLSSTKGRLLKEIFKLRRRLGRANTAKQEAELHYRAATNEIDYLRARLRKKSEENFTLESQLIEKNKRNDTSDPSLQDDLQVQGMADSLGSSRRQSRDRKIPFSKLWPTNWSGSDSSQRPDKASKKKGSIEMSVLKLS